ncbi:MAG: GNAT family N-acetyltransferase [Candidatus Sabulitectum sp.]|nr:GNAT family N-acetyltransferase [Candidatus Sabulitectum sp.]
MNLISSTSVIETGRLVLREHTMQDAKAILELFGDTEVVRHFGMKPIKSIADARQLIEFFQKSREETGLNRWAVVLKDEDAMVGSIFYTNIERPYYRAEIGFLLNRVYWGRGIMREAAERIISYGFEVMNFNKIQALVSVENGRSINLIEKLGFTREGILREHNFNYVENGFEDMYSFALLARTSSITSNRKFYE